MGFVYEEISAEKEKELLDKYHFMQDYARNTPAIIRHWAIDKDRDAFIVYEAGPWAGARQSPDDAMPPGRAKLVWGDNTITIVFFRVVDQIKREVSWHIEKITAPDALRDQEKEILELSKDAINAMEDRGQDTANTTGYLGLVESPDYVHFDDEGK